MVAHGLGMLAAICQSTDTASQSQNISDRTSNAVHMTQAVLNLTGRPVWPGRTSIPGERDASLARYIFLLRTTLQRQVR